MSEPRVDFDYSAADEAAFEDVRKAAITQGHIEGMRTTVEMLGNCKNGKEMRLRVEVLRYIIAKSKPVAQLASELGVSRKTFYAELKRVKGFRNVLQANNGG